jgi:hypothetical protein
VQHEVEAAVNLKLLSDHELAELEQLLLKANPLLAGQK